MDFADALRQVKAHKRIARAGWNGKGMWVAAQFPDTHSKMGAPYLYIRTVDGTLVPWTVSQADVFANDWAAVPE